MQVTGNCHCGKITFRATVSPEDVTICHCTDCQVLTGTVYRVSIPAIRNNFELLSGQPKIYVKTAEDGSKRAQAFCSDCGTPLYASDVNDPQVYNLRVGTLLQRATLRPHHQIWCRSALPWSESLSGIPGITKD